MCRNITALRGLEPEATDVEIVAAALQYVRKVAALSSISPANREAVDHAVAEIAATTTRLLDELPARRQPPKTEPPLRRIAARELELEHRNDNQHDHDEMHSHGDHVHSH